MQTIELQKMGLMEMRHEECVQVNGGGIWEMLFKSAIEHFDELAKGLEAGWNFDKSKNN